MLQSNKFQVTIVGTHSVEIPFDEAATFLENGHSRVAFKAYFNGNEIAFHGKLHKRHGQVFVSFGKRYQKKLGVSKDDFFQLQLFEDTTKYGVEMPEEFSAVLETDFEAFELFQKLTDGKKRSLIYHILRIKDTQKRIDRALLICENLKMGISDLKLLTRPLR